MPSTNDNETVCHCNHLTDFGGGGPLPAVNRIDFGGAFDGFNNIGDNPVVFSICVCLILIFFLLLFWARRKDKKLDAKVKGYESYTVHEIYYYYLLYSKYRFPYRHPSCSKSVGKNKKEKNKVIFAK